MNWLAHIFLSENNIDFQIANYLADPLKGKYWHDANINIKKGMYIHKLIDSYTDKHPIFKQSKNRLGKKGLLKGVVVDLTYDYLLTKNWQAYSKVPIDSFLNDFYEKANKQLATLPINARKHLERLIQHDILNKNKNLNDLQKAFFRVDKKLSIRLSKRDTTSRYFETVSQNILELEKDFLYFFPQLCEVVRTNIDKNNLSHWKI